MADVEFLLEYLKEHYFQARHKDTLQAGTTALLATAAGAVLAYAFKTEPSMMKLFAIGVVVFLLGLANWWTSRAYYQANRFHTGVAKIVREKIEHRLGLAPDETGSAMRKEACAYRRLPRDYSASEAAQTALDWVPRTIMAIGFLLAAYAALKIIPNIHYTAT